MSAPVAAFFDVDGTLTRTTTLHPLYWYEQAHLPPARFALWAAGLYLEAPYYWALDKASRRRFNVVFYRRYRGLNYDALCRWHRDAFAETLRRKLFPAAEECVREHQRQGHRIVLLTGGLHCVMQPLAEYLGADGLIASRLKTRDGLCTGELDGPPLAGEEKAGLLRAYAAEHGIDLGGSFAYADSYSDIPMLECTGQAVAVRPDGRLLRRAQARGWRVVEWRLRE
ncbi:MAG TPA: HAD family hydrolase [Gemmataceae bacterium]|nr:HAD family hydrolase [Gemmataceae bacterium]